MVYFALTFLFLVTLIETFLLFLFRKIPSYLTHFLTGIACGFLIHNTIHLFFANINVIFYFILLSFSVFFLLDQLSHKLLSTTVSLPLLVTFIDLLHNGVDGGMVTLAFQKDIQTGWEVTFAVFFHEISQELLDILAFFLSGFQLVPALLLNAVANISLFAAPFFLKNQLGSSVLISLLIGALAYLSFRFFKMRLSLLPKTSYLQIVGEIGLGVLIFGILEKVLSHFLHLSV